MSNPSLSNSQSVVYIITETTGHTSLDPLDGDKTNNFAVQRMIYLTPIEIGPENTLVSQILSDFYFETKKNEIVFILKDNQLFSDGSKIEPMDLVYAITRMLKKRPTFPVIRNIKGKEEWLLAGSFLNILPEGITINGQVVTVKLDQEMKNPLYRFCMEIFSIIPRKCIDPITSEMICKEIPTSGPYKIVKQSDNEVIFAKRSTDKIYDLNAPSEVIFKYMQNTKFDHKFRLDKNQIITTNEAKLTPDEQTFLSNNFNIVKKPSSSFSVFLVNKKSKLLNNKILRVWLANRFRKAYSEANRVNIESSIFTKIIPGYLPHNELSKYAVNIPEPTKREIEELESLVWFENPAHEMNLLRTPLQIVFENAGIKLPVPVRFRSYIDFQKAFIKGDVDIMYASTGFWPLDPVGDIQMLFTSNMHEILEGIWTDKKLQDLLSKLDILSEGIDSFEEINRYLFDDAYFNVFSHFARLYIQSNVVDNRIFPTGITAPPAWMLFANKAKA